MIVRTTPGLPVDRDVIRVLGRLESQLRRAADDLSEAIASMEPAEPPVEELVLGRCGQLMRDRVSRCGRRPGHRPGCRSTQAMKRDSVKSRRIREKARA